MINVDSPASRRSFPYMTAVAHGTAALCAVIMYLTAPTTGEFWWSEAPRNALNGVFVHDILSDLPFGDLEGYATGYYLQYPALTILFYPPLLYAVLAAFYSVLGIDHWVAQLAVSSFHFALGVGAYVLARRYMSEYFALAAAVTLMSVPEVALWGRQVMLEIPAYALMVWALWALSRWHESGAARFLYAGAGLLGLAVYTKLSVVFIIPTAVVWLALRRRSLLIGDRHVWIAGALFACALAPLVAMTVVFGQGNLQSVAGIADAAVSRKSIAGWTWYAERLPEQLGWAVLGAAVVGAGMLILSPRARIGKAGPELFALWFVAGYCFFSLIDLKEARHSVLILFPVVFAAFAGLAMLRPAWLGRHVATALAVGTVVWITVWAPVPRVEGYRAAAEFVNARLPQGGVVLFSGYRDGSFIYNLRVLDASRSLTVIRADKLLLRVAIRRELGVETRDFSESEIVQLIRDHGVSYIVAQSDFWIDLPPMARLQNVLRTAGFVEEDRIRVDANVPVEDQELRIYRSPFPPPELRRPLVIELPTIGRTLGPER